MNSTKPTLTTTHFGRLNAWFDSIHYQKLYGHRDEAEAANFIDALIRCLRPHPGSRLLDVACGTGRHAKYLASKGYRVTGFDLAADSIRVAKQAERRGLRFFRHDMRLPFGRNKFDYVFNFFTSFGYFESLAEHFEVLRNMTRSLSDGGTLVLDYLNVYRAEAELVPYESKKIGNFAYALTRWSDRNYIFKRIVLERRNADEPHEYVERVAKFTLWHFQQMFAACGYAIHEVYGDYTLNPFHMVDSPRLILIARGAQISPLPNPYANDSFVDSLAAFGVEQRDIGGVTF